MPGKKLKIEAQGHEIAVLAYENQDDFISLTDIARQRSDEPFIVINNWMRSRSTIEYLGLWEKMYNPNFNPIEFDRFKNNSGANAFTLSPKKWIESTKAIGIISKAGRYGGTYANKDIAFEFASWISPEFKLYIIKDYQRLREEEQYRLSTDWNLRRELSKTNYRIHTDAIKENLIHNELTKAQISMTYADEADLLNVALFGQTAKEWKAKNPSREGNMRDCATIEELIIMANLESANAQFISESISQSERLLKLNQMARFQLKSLLNSSIAKKLEEKTSGPKRLT